MLQAGDVVILDGAPKAIGSAALLLRNRSKQEVLPGDIVAINRRSFTTKIAAHSVIGVASERIFIGARGRVQMAGFVTADPR